MSCFRNSFGVVIFAFNVFFVYNFFITLPNAQVGIVIATNVAYSQNPSDILIVQQPTDLSDTGLDIGLKDPHLFPYRYKACEDPLGLLDGKDLQISGINSLSTAKLYKNPNSMLSYEKRVFDKDLKEEKVTVEKGIKCIPLSGYWDEIRDTVDVGGYKHYHYVLNAENIKALHNPSGATITFKLEPCSGLSEIFVKPQILWKGQKMWQLFETTPPASHTGNNTTVKGTRSKMTWPFPDKNTGYLPQGPDDFLVDIERYSAENTARSKTLFDAKVKAQNDGLGTVDVNAAIEKAKEAADIAAAEALSHSSVKYPASNFGENCWGFHGIKDVIIRLKATGDNIVSKMKDNATVISLKEKIANVAGFGITSTQIKFETELTDSDDIILEINILGSQSSILQAQCDSACEIVLTLTKASITDLGGLKLQISSKYRPVSHSPIVSQSNYVSSIQTISLPVTHGGWLISVYGLSSSSFSVSVELKANDASTSSDANPIGVQDYTYAQSLHVPNAHPLYVNMTDAIIDSTIKCGDFDDNESKCLLHCCNFQPDTKKDSIVNFDWVLPKSPGWLWGLLDSSRDGSELPKETLNTNKNKTSHQGKCIPTVLVDSLCAVEIPSRNLPMIRVFWKTTNVEREQYLLNYVERPDCKSEMDSFGHTLIHEDGSDCNANIRERGSCGVNVPPTDCVMWTGCGVERNGISIQATNRHESTPFKDRNVTDTDNTDSTDNKSENEGNRRLKYLMSIGNFEPSNIMASSRVYETVAAASERLWNTNSLNMNEPSAHRTGSEGGHGGGNWTVSGWAYEDIYVKNNVSYYVNVLRRDPLNGRVETYGKGLQVRHSYYRVTQNDTNATILTTFMIASFIFLASLLPLYISKKGINTKLNTLYKKHHLRRKTKLRGLMKSNREKWNDQYGRWLRLEKFSYIFGKSLIFESGPKQFVYDENEKQIQNSDFPILTDGKNNQDDDSYEEYTGSEYEDDEEL